MFYVVNIDNINTKTMIQLLRSWLGHVGYLFAINMLPLRGKPQTPSPKPQTPNPKSQTPNPQPPAPNP